MNTNDATFKEPRQGIPLPPNEPGYTNRYKTIRGGVVKYLDVNPPELTKADTTITKIRHKTGRQSLTTFFVKYPSPGTGIQIARSLGYLFSTDRIKIGLRLIYRDFDSVQLYEHVPFLAALTGVTLLDAENIWKVFMQLSEKTVEYYCADSARGSVWTGAMLHGRNGILQERINKDFQVLYNSCARTPLATHLTGSPFEDRWDFEEETINKKSPFIHYLSEELGLLVDDLQFDLISKLRMALPLILEKHDIVGIKFEDLRWTAPLVTASTAKTILEAVSVHEGEAHHLLWASRAVECLTIHHLIRLGIHPLARGLSKTQATTLLPLSVVALSSALIEIELESLRGIRRHDGIAVFEASSIGRVVESELVIWRKHYNLLSALPSSARFKTSFEAVAKVVTSINKGFDLEYSFA